MNISVPASCLRCERLHSLVASRGGRDRLTRVVHGADLVARMQLEVGQEREHLCAIGVGARGGQRLGEQLAVSPWIPRHGPSSGRRD